MTQSQANLLPLLEVARQRGFTHDFILNEDGTFHCQSVQITQYKTVGIIQCLASKASIYLLAGETMSGTWIDYWDI